MNVSINISQIDNGFILSLFDADGPAIHNEKLFFENLDEALKKIKKWMKVLGE